MDKTTKQQIAQVLGLAPGAAAQWTHGAVTVSLIREGRHIGPVEYLSLKVDEAGHAEPVVYALSCFYLGQGGERVLEHHLEHMIEVASGGQRDLDLILGHYVTSHDPITLVVPNNYWLAQPAGPEYDPMIDHAQAVYWFDRPATYNTSTNGLFTPEDRARDLAALVQAGYLVISGDPQRFYLTPSGRRWLIPHLQRLRTGSGAA